MNLSWPLYIGLGLLLLFSGYYLYSNPVPVQTIAGYVPINSGNGVVLYPTYQWVPTFPYRTQGTILMILGVVVSIYGYYSKKVQNSP